MKEIKPYKTGEGSFGEGGLEYQEKDWKDMEILLDRHLPVIGSVGKVQPVFRYFTMIAHAIVVIGIVFIVKKDSTPARMPAGASANPTGISRTSQSGASGTILRGSPAGIPPGGLATNTDGGSAISPATNPAEVSVTNPAQVSTTNPGGVLGRIPVAMRAVVSPGSSGGEVAPLIPGAGGRVSREADLFGKVRQRETVDRKSRHSRRHNEESQAVMSRELPPRDHTVSGQRAFNIAAGVRRISVVRDPVFGAVSKSDKKKSSVRQRPGSLSLGLEIPVMQYYNFGQDEKFRFVGIPAVTGQYALTKRLGIGFLLTPYQNIYFGTQRPIYMSSSRDSSSGPGYTVTTKKYYLSDLSLFGVSAHLKYTIQRHFFAEAGFGASELWSGKGFGMTSILRDTLQLSQNAQNIRYSRNSPLFSNVRTSNVYYYAGAGLQIHKWEVLLRYNHSLNNWVRNSAVVTGGSINLSFRYFLLGR